MPPAPFSVLPQPSPSCITQSLQSFSSVSLVYSQSGRALLFQPSCSSLPSSFHCLGSCLSPPWTFLPTDSCNLSFAHLCLEDTPGLLQKTSTLPPPWNLPPNPHLLSSIQCLLRQRPLQYYCPLYDSGKTLKLLATHPDCLCVVAHTITLLLILILFTTYYILLKKHT